jgi:hypothetical protein
MALIDSPLLDMLNQGELPVIKVEIQKNSIVGFAIALIIVIMIAMLMYALFIRTSK